MFTENLRAFLSTKEHAETLVYTPGSGGGSVNVDGIFEADYKDPLGFVQSEGVTFICRLADVPSVKNADVFVRGAKTYKVRTAERDWGGGLGLVLVHLEEQ